MTTAVESVGEAPPWHAFRIAVWLVWNDVKQGLRKHLAATGTRDRLLRGGGALVGLAFLVGLHAAALALVTYTYYSPSSDKAALMAGLSTSIWSFLVFVMLSGGLVRALVVLHEQDDSNLLLSSPVSPRAILAGRLFGNALQSCLVDGFIIVPYINIRIFTLGLHLNFLWGYPVWFALAVVVTCLDGLFSFGLIRLFGLRRARFFAQAVPFLLIFAVTFSAGTLSVSVAQLSATGARMPPAMQAHFIGLTHTPLVWIAYAAAGYPLYLVGLGLFTVALAALTLRLTERAFVEGTQHVAESAGGHTRSREGPFRAGPLALEIRKNLRLVARTPMMLVQCLAQSLMPIGIACVLGREDIGRAVAFFVIFACGVLSGMFTIAAGTVEECADLLAMAPREGILFRIGKISSGLLWPVATALVVSAGLLICGQGLLAVAVLCGGIPLGVASSIAGETFAKAVKPGVRPKLMADPVMMIPLLGMQIVSGLVAGAAVFAAAMSSWYVVLALIGSYLLLLLIVGLAQLRKPLFG